MLARNTKSPKAKRPVFVRNTTFVKGSNIPFLSSDEINGQPNPSLPLIRVRNQGREILDRGNKSSWYEHMIEGSEVSREKRKQEAMRRDKAAAGEAGNADGENKLMQEQQIKTIEKHDTPLLEPGESEDDKKIRVASNSPSDVKCPEAKKTEQERSLSPEAFLSDEALEHRRRPGNLMRRLHGDVAKQCAQRDEGCLKDLIWYQECKKVQVGEEQEEEQQEEQEKEEQEKEKGQEEEEEKEKEEVKHVDMKSKDSLVSDKPTKKRKPCQADSGGRVKDLLVSKFSPN